MLGKWMCSRVDAGAAVQPVQHRKVCNGCTARNGWSARALQGQTDMQYPLDAALDCWWAHSASSTGALCEPRFSVDRSVSGLQSPMHPAPPRSRDKWYKLARAMKQVHHVHRHVHMTCVAPETQYCIARSQRQRHLGITPKDAHRRGIELAAVHEVPAAAAACGDACRGTTAHTAPSSPIQACTAAACVRLGKPGAADGSGMLEQVVRMRRTPQQ
jgi:hypothetical protein